MNNLINILIRTHRRPEGFKKLIDSIKSQTYKNYRIIVSIDDMATFEYVLKHKIRIDDIVLIDGEDVNNKVSESFVGSNAPYNLYFNLLLQKVDEGYVYCMDDDDYFKDENSLKVISENIEEDTLSIFKMSIWNTELPSHSFGKSITLADIGTPCFCAHSKYAKQVLWGYSYTADGEYIQELSKIIPKIKWVDEVVYVVPKNSMGRSEI